MTTTTESIKVISRDIQTQVIELLRQVPGWESLRFSDLSGFKPMNGGTNKGYYFENADGQFVLRLSGENAAFIGINRDAEFAALELTSAAGLSPAVRQYYRPEGHLLTRFFFGDELGWDEMSAYSARAAVVLRRVHELPEIPFEFSPLRDIRYRLARCQELGITLPGVTDDHVAQTQRICDRYWCRSYSDRGLCHGDAYPNNYMASDDSLILIDWEFAGMGDIYYDLNASALACTAEDRHRFLEVYFGDVPSYVDEKMAAIRYVSWIWNWTWALLQLHFWNNDSTHLEQERGLFGAMQSALGKW